MSRLHSPRHGRTNPLFMVSVVSAVVLGCLVTLLAVSGIQRGDDADELTLFCAAGMRVPMEKIVTEYQRESGVNVRVQYGGSNTLLSQLEVSQTGDLYLAADTSYTDMAREKGLLKETVPLAFMRPVIAVAAGNPKNIKGIQDLLRDDVRVAMGNPDQAAIGKKARKLLTASGHWKALEERVRRNGVFKPTVPEVANDVKLGTVIDAGIIWDAVANQYDGVEGIRTPELDRGTGSITLGVLTSSKHPTAALKFARYVASKDKGLATFKSTGYEVALGDKWAERPQITFFAGAVNRRAIESVVKAFAQREGVEINTVYNGCGILTSQMRTLKEQKQSSGFPDIYMACDVYYLETVADWFEAGTNVSNTDIVIVVQKGNPKQIRGLADLHKDGVRLALGQPEQCTIGVLSRRLLKKEGLYEQLMKDNVVTQTATSAMLVPSIITGHADAVLAYSTDTLAEADKLETVAIDSPLARAVQPFTISKNSEFKHLASRLFDAIRDSRSQFEDAGFHWQLDKTSPDADNNGSDQGA